MSQHNISAVQNNIIPDDFARTELDSHAMSPVVGYNSYVWRDTGQFVDVSPFTSSLGKLTRIQVVDALIQYECPLTVKNYILVIYNALYVPEMKHNLLTPFLVREAGIELNETPKIQAEDPSMEYHSMYFKNEDLRIHLGLQGIISYFTSRKPTMEEVASLPRIDLTPDRHKWDPHDNMYSRHEESMIDFEGNIIIENEKEDKQFFDYPDSDEDIMDVLINAVYMEDIAPELTDKICNDAQVIGYESHVPNLIEHEEDNQVASVLTSVTHSLDPPMFADALNERVSYSKFAMSIGSTLSEPRYVIGATHQARAKGITPSKLARVFRIDIPTAKRTLEVTSQHVRREEDPSLNRNYPTNDRMLRYKRIKDHFFTDTFFASKTASTSIRGNTCMQIFVTDKGYVFVVAMKRKGDAHKAYKRFFKRIGVPDALITDGAREQALGDAKKICDQVGTTLRQLERNTPWSNRAELYVGLIKRAVKKDLKKSNCPMCLWDYCAERRAQVNNVTAKDLFQLDGQTSHYTVTGDEPDISNISQFEWYEWVYYREQAARFPFPSEVLGRVLGPAYNAGNEMAQWVLKINGKVVPRRTCRSLNEEELISPTEENKRQTFDSAIKRKLGDSLIAIEIDEDKMLADPFLEEIEPLDDEDGVPQDIPEADNDAYDELINAEVLLPLNDKMQSGTVIGRAKNNDGNGQGRRDANPMLDTRIYDVMFPDGTVNKYATNIIAENMYSQVDTEGFQYQLMEEIIDHRVNDRAVLKEDKFINTPRGGRKLRKTTIGWDLKVLWKHGETTWVPLKDIKESNPVEVAEYAKAQGIDDEAAFCWWVPFTLRKRDRIICAVNSRVKKSTHKYGVKIPNTVEEAFKLDKENGNDLWRKAINKEMGNVLVAFNILEEHENLPPGFTKATCHIMFTVKMDFTRKARYVKDGHRTPDPEGSKYAGVVSRDSVRIALTYAALNDIDVTAADIRNAYLQAPPSEKHYIICGPEFGVENIGKRAIIERALYGGKTSGRDFRNSLRSCMTHLGFTSCLADPDVWMRKATKSDGSPYWEYMLLYVDDALVISENGETVLRDELGKYFQLKEESIGPPDIYLGGKVTKVMLKNGAMSWAFSASQYVKSAVKNVEDYLSDRDMKLPGRAKSPLGSNYRPEIDLSDELDPVMAAYYQSLIGILRWAVELGRVDITCEVSMMASHLALPREGHLQQLFHIFGYLKRNHNSEMVFDPSDPQVDMNQFPRQDWESTEFGNDLSEDLPRNAPEPRGIGFVMRAFVDADHAGDSITRKSRTGFIVYLNCAPIYWLSKKQNGIETSSFGSEFTAMKQCTEYVRGLRYKLRMLGIPVELPTYIYGDNQSVLANTTVPDSTLKKKSNSIAYHFVREGCARDEWRTTYVNTHENVADLLTKPLPSGEKRTGFVKMILHHV